ncbi:MAG: serine--tRNA ligase [Patescibacteria group bacterium]
MLDIKIIRDDPFRVRKGLESRGMDPKLVDDFLAFDEKWRDLTKQSEDLRAEQRKAGDAKDIEKAKSLKDQFQNLEAELSATEKDREGLLIKFPNLPFEDVPVGKSEVENQVLRQVGKPTEFDFEPTDYLTLAAQLDLIDVERAGKVSGSRFGYLKNDAVVLEFALIDLAFKTLIKEGFTPIVPPVLVKPEIMKGMGKYKFVSEKDAYHLEEDDLYLVGSSEHSIGPYHSGETILDNQLPKRYVGFSTCFRREAGSYGKDTRGILRVHQFDKVEMLSFVKPGDSEKEHQFLLSIQEKFMQALELPYRVVAVCTGDSDATAARQFDIETWLPSEKKYRETHSVSNTTDYQSRSLNIKYAYPVADTDKGANMVKKYAEYVHMLNGTAIAIPRALIAIIETYQTKDRKIRVPKVLQNYVGKKEIG